MSSYSFDRYLSRFVQWSKRLDRLMLIKRPTKAVRAEISLCKREMTYNRNRLLGGASRRTGAIAF